MDGERLATRLRDLREAATLTRETLAERSGASVRTIAALELGTVGMPRVSTLGALADALGLESEARASIVALARHESSARAVPRELPPVTRDLIGRDELVAVVAEHVRGAHEDDAAPRLWLVSGVPGAGKSTLALHVAHAVADAFPDGQLHVALGEGAAPSRRALVADALRRVLVAMGAHPATLPGDLDGLAGALRTRLADARVLLVFDDAPPDVDLTPLLPASASAAVLVTSRAVPASLPVTRHDVLDRLDPESALRMLAGIVGADRVGAEPEASSALAERCGRLPVGIRVAGARLAASPSTSLEEAAERLRDERARLDLLSAGDLGVRASLAAAFDALDGREQAALAMLGDLGSSVVPTWCVAAALDVRHADAVVLVERLSEVGLVETAGAGPAHRAIVHDLTRLFAHERAERAATTSERATRLERVLDRWRHLGDAAIAHAPVVVDEPADVPAPRTPAPPGAELEAIVGEPSTWFVRTTRAMLAHVEHALEIVPVGSIWPTLALLWRAWRTSDLVDDVSDLLELVATRCTEEGDRRGAAAMRTLLASYSLSVMPAEQRMAMLEAAAAEFAALGDDRGRAKALARVGLVSLEALDDSGDARPRALDATRAAMAAARACGSDAAVHDASVARARVALAAGRLDDAAETIARARASVRTAPPQWLAQLDWIEGMLLRSRGCHGEAEARLRRALDHTTSTGDRWGTATLEDELAEVLVLRGDPGGASALLASAAGRARSIGLERMADRLEARRESLARDLAADTR